MSGEAVEGPEEGREEAEAPEALRPPLSPVPGPEANLWRRLLWIMGEAEWVPRRGWNDFHRYAYATEADVVDSLRKLFVRAGVMWAWEPIRPEGGFERRERRTQSGVTYVTEMAVEFQFVNADDPSEVRKFVVYGEGEDPSDKGLYKAYTGAIKYALMKSFMVPTGDDPELASAGDRPAPNDRRESGPPPSSGGKGGRPPKDRGKARRTESPPASSTVRKPANPPSEELAPMTPEDRKKVRSYVLGRVAQLRPLADSLTADQRDAAITSAEIAADPEASDANLRSAGRRLRKIASDLALPELPKRQEAPAAPPPSPNPPPPPEVPEGAPEAPDWTDEDDDGNPTLGLDGGS